MKEWIKSDDNQWIYQISDNVFKLIELRESVVKDMWVIGTAVIDISDYTEEELQDELSGYYDSLDDVKSLYPDCNDQRQIAAECIFENMFLDLDVWHFSSYEEADNFLKDFIENYKG